MYMLIVGICFQSMLSLISVMIRDKHEVLSFILIGPFALLLEILILCSRFYRKIKLNYIRANYNQYMLYKDNLLSDYYYIHKDISKKFNENIFILTGDIQCNSQWKLIFDKPCNNIKSLPHKKYIISKYGSNRSVNQKNILEKFAIDGKVFH